MYNVLSNNDFIIDIDLLVILYYIDDYDIFCQV